jgi:hypothetical protein
VVFRERGLIVTNLCPEGRISKRAVGTGNWEHRTGQNGNSKQEKWGGQCETLHCYWEINIR